MKVAILYDVDGWAFHHEALGMQKYLRSLGIYADIERYPTFFAKTADFKKRSKATLPYDCVFLYPRQAKGITFPLEKMAVKISSYGKFNYQEENGAPFGACLCTSRDIMKESIRELPKHPFIVFSPPSVDTEVFHPSTENLLRKDGPLRVGFSGNTERPVKRFHIFEEVMQNHKGFSFKVSSFKKEGRLPHEEMPEFYRSIDVLVCTSTHEGGPLTAYEAGACGTPTVFLSEKTAIAGDSTPGYNSFKATEETLGETLEMLAFNRDLLTNAKLAIANTIHANHSWRNNIFSYVGILNLLSQR